MSLAKWLAKAGAVAEEFGPQLGQMYGEGFRKAGLDKLGALAGEIGFRHPKTATALGLGVIPVGAPLAIGAAGEGIDAALPHDPNDVPEEVKQALKQAGYKGQYEYAGRSPGKGAAMGANLGILANIAAGNPKSSLLKWALMGALGGGALGAGVQSYYPKGEEQ